MFCRAADGFDMVLTVRDFNLMKSLGMNSFRVNSNPPTPATLDLADKYGFLVQSESASIALRGGLGPRMPDRRAVRAHGRLRELDHAGESQAFGAGLWTRLASTYGASQFRARDRYSLCLPIT